MANYERPYQRPTSHEHASHGESGHAPACREPAWVRVAVTFQPVGGRQWLRSHRHPVLSPDPPPVVVVTLQPVGG
jgi:hypothetical protein